MHDLNFIPALHQNIHDNRISGAVLLRSSKRCSSAQGGPAVAAPNHKNSRFTFTARLQLARAQVRQALEEHVGLMDVSRSGYRVEQFKNRALRHRRHERPVPLSPS